MLRILVGMATNLYHVTVGIDKQKVATEDNTIRTLEAAIRRKFSISTENQLRLQIEDQDFPGEWVNLMSSDVLPTKAKINVIVIGKFTYGDSRLAYSQKHKSFGVRTTK